MTVTDLPKTKVVNWGWWIITISALLIGIGSYRYLIPGNYGLAPPILANSFAHLGILTLHAGFAGTALILGPFQFLPTLRRAKPTLHRMMGKAYVGCCLVSGVAGLTLAFGAKTGPISTVGFGTLAVLWLFTTSQAWRLAMARRFADHERWMIRSFALTLAAVTLRIYLPFAFMSPWGYDNTYRAISILCWVPNLIAAEMWLRARSNPVRG